jgi:hypothetical protein
MHGRQPPKSEHGDGLMGQSVSLALAYSIRWLLIWTFLEFVEMSK